MAGRQPLPPHRRSRVVEDLRVGSCLGLGLPPAHCACLAGVVPTGTPDSAGSNFAIRHGSWPITLGTATVSICRWLPAGLVALSAVPVALAGPVCGCRSVL